MTSTKDMGREAPPPSERKPFYKVLYIQVLIAIVLGVIVGLVVPQVAVQPWMKALGDGFVKLIKMVITPIIFCTVVSGIAHISDARKVGRVALKALFYFEVISTLALVLGLLVGNFAGVGQGFSGQGNAAAVDKFSKEAASHNTVEFLLNIIPDSVVGAFAKGDVLQVLLFAILFGFALMFLGERGKVIASFIDDIAHGVFGVIAIVMKAAPIGAFGAMAYTVG